MWINRDDLETKILSLIDRISKAYEYVLRKCSSKHGMTPLQAELMILVGSSSLASSVTKASRFLLVAQPTLSDSLSALKRKGLLETFQDNTDRRVTRFKLTKYGEEVLMELQRCLEEFRVSLRDFEREHLRDLFRGLIMLTRNLYRVGIVREARMCLTCRYFSSSEGEYYCSLLKMRMSLQDLKIECPDHEPEVQRLSIGSGSRRSSL